ncbi:extracellular solute-binding protein [Vallitalea okinawensis]|uniref:extracellular solute-binding protein n=1 Tax=Vallitalea okinawensis TaxID=2078660 RepID=UPI000CFDDE53|nr:extracellular solute-binding protein [Vallitalea okinawensis]
MKKVLISFLVAILLVSAITGCSDEKDTTKVTTDNENANQDQSENVKVEEGTKSVSIFLPSMTDDNGELVYVLQKAQEVTGIEIIAHSGNTAEYSKLDTSIAAGDIPDAIALTNAFAMETYIETGMLVDLTDLINEHAPNIKAYFDANPEAKTQATWKDGKIYNIPSYNVDESSTSDVFLIREDWMKEYREANNKQDGWMPITLEELEEVFAYWKSVDPNRVCFFDRRDLDSKSHIAGPNILGLVGAHYLFYYDSNGDVQFGAFQEEFKDGLTLLRRWVEAGYIDPDLPGGTKSDLKNKREQLWSAEGSLGGMTYTSSESVLNYGYSMDDAGNKVYYVDGFELTAWEPAAGWVWSTNDEPFAKRGLAITSTAQDPVTAIKFLDFWFTEEGIELKNFGVEGETYEIIDGDKKLKEEFSTPEVFTPMFIRTSEFGLTGDTIISGGEVDPALAAVREINNPYTRVLNDTNWFRTGINTLDTHELAEYTELMSQIRLEIDTLIIGILTGKSTIEKDYDAFVERIYALGYENVEELAIKAWEAYKESYGLEPKDFDIHTPPTR